ncbi:phosphatase PAP2 family protein [Sphingomonas sp. ASV193]|uniref:phosphatase PAP2 family protein n=1 Tax=Sphingomonas sp. ASV193 TaxID=3144405 RepID=UPI0032E8B32E
MRARLEAMWLAAALTAATPAAAAPRGWTPNDWDVQDWDRVSGIVRTGLAGFSLGTPLLDGEDRAVRRQAKALLLAGGITFALKSTIHERRPDGSNNQSFPSGHTAISFAAAAGLGQRYGWKVGLPAHLLAGFVGLARVKADKHYWHDVLVGAAIGEAAGLLLVHKRSKHDTPVPLAASLTLAF